MSQTAGFAAGSWIVRQAAKRNGEETRMPKDYFHSPQWQRLIQRTCPDYDCNNQVCLASSSRMIPGRKQQIRYCATDDYDNCPIYLCKALRSSAPQGLDRDTLVDSGK
jgi:hypothetical protein